MKRALIILAAGVALVAAPAQPRATDSAASAPAGTLLYLDQAGWRQADNAQKMVLAADFMRIYCGDPAMPTSDLVVCLDGDHDSGSMFARALSCVATYGNRASAARL